MVSLHPYLVFNGNCEEAFCFYKAVFCGDILFMGRYKDVPHDARPSFPGATDEQIMHATLQISPSTVLMGNDNTEIYQQAKGVPKTFFLYVSTKGQAEAHRIFNELATGGNVIMPIGQTFWSADYGIVTDRFGIGWKITAEPDKV